MSNNQSINARDSTESKNPPKYKKVLDIKLGYQVAGEIKQDELGGACLEGELNTPKWSQANAYATSLASAICQSLGMKSGSIVIKQRFTEAGAERLLAMVTLQALSEEKVDSSLVKQIATAFIQQTVHQVDAFELAVAFPEPLSEKMVKNVELQVQKFLTAFGGHAIKRTMQVQADGIDLGVAKGTWQEDPNKAERKDVERTIIGAYNGRRLKSRVMFVIQGGSQTKELEVFYDHQKFHKKIQVLQEDETAILKLDCIDVPMGSTSRLVLRDMSRVIQNPNGFNLTGD